MKVNGTQGEYTPVSTGLQSDEDETHKATLEDGLKNGHVNEKKIANGLEATKEPEEKKGPMSPLRKFCFVLSLLQCALFIIAFGWLIPCKIPRLIDSNPVSWKYQLKNVDIVTELTYAKIEKKLGVVVFGVSSPTNATQHGLYALDTLYGTELWYKELPFPPVSVHCEDHLMLTSNSTPSCLITDERGQMLAVALKDGHMQWMMFNHTKKTTVAPSVLSKPSIVDDCSGDGIPEILIAGQEGKDSFSVYVVDGKTGSMLTTISLKSTCGALPTHLVTWRSKNLKNSVLVCADQTEPTLENIWSTPLHNFCTNSSYAVFSSLDIGKIPRLEKGDSVSDMRIVTDKDGDDHLVIVSKKGQISLAASDSEIKDISLPDGAIFRDITGGSFVNATAESLAILYGNSDHTTTILLTDLFSGSTLNNLSYTQHEATFIYTAENGFDETDTLIIRNIPHQHHAHNAPAVLPKAIESNSTDGADSKHMTTVATPALVGEEFVALDCKVNATYSSLWKLPQSLACFGGAECSKHVNARTSVILGDFGNSGKTSMIHSFPVMDETSKVETTHLIMENIFYYLPEKKCKSCGC